MLGTPPSRRWSGVDPGPRSASTPCGLMSSTSRLGSAEQAADLEPGGARLLGAHGHAEPGGRVDLAIGEVAEQVELVRGDHEVDGDRVVRDDPP